MTTATATAAAGTTGRRVAVTFADGTAIDFADKNARFLAIVRDVETGELAIVKGSATRDGAAAGARQGVANGVWADPIVVEITDPAV